MCSVFKWIQVGGPQDCKLSYEFMWLVMSQSGPSSDSKMGGPKIWIIIHWSQFTFNPFVLVRVRNLQEFFVMSAIWKKLTSVSAKSNARVHIEMPAAFKSKSGWSSRLWTVLWIHGPKWTVLRLKNGRPQNVEVNGWEKIIYKTQFTFEPKPFNAISVDSRLIPPGR